MQDSPLDGEVIAIPSVPSHDTSLRQTVLLSDGNYETHQQ